MVKINSYDDVRVAYEILEIAYETGRAKTQKVIDIKREMRKFFNRPSDRKVIKDEGMDGYTELLVLPEYIDTMGEAIRYFKDYDYRRYYPSAYDCTGQTFTSWYKVFARGGRFWVYHGIGVDI